MRKSTLPHTERLLDAQVCIKLCTGSTGFISQRERPRLRAVIALNHRPERVTAEIPACSSGSVQGKLPTWPQRVTSSRQIRNGAPGFSASGKMPHLWLPPDRQERQNASH